jgi:hypothetical protein
LLSQQYNLLQKLYALEDNLTNLSIAYWTRYSGPSTWQFWVDLLLLIIPLVVLYFKLDRGKIFLIGFFGFNIHVWFNYIDAIGVRLALWGYPYQLIPLAPVNYTLEGSLIPVTYMLAFQWTLNHKKNTYLYLTGVAVFLAFIFKPILSAIGFFHLNRTNYFVLFLAYIVIMLVSIWITKFFLFLQHKQGVTFNQDLTLGKIAGKKEKAK